MSISIDEKRHFIRMQIDCPMRIKSDGVEGQSWGVVKNLSGSGLMFWANQSYREDDLIELILEPTNPITPPLIAKAWVQRCDSLPEEGEDKYEIACFMQEVS